jgi:hypothetical protein
VKAVKKREGERMDGTERSIRGRYLGVEGAVHGAGKVRIFVPRRAGPNPVVVEQDTAADINRIKSGGGL